MDPTIDSNESTSISTHSNLQESYVNYKYGNIRKHCM